MHRRRAGRRGRGPGRRCPFAEARRQLFGIRRSSASTSAASSSASACSRSPASSIFFFENVYDFETARRGVVTARRPAPALFAGLLSGERARTRYARDRRPGRLATPHRARLRAGRRRPAAHGACRRGSGSSCCFVFVANIGFSALQPAYLPARRADRAAAGAHAGVRLLADPRRPRRRRSRRVSSATSATAPGYRVAIGDLSLDRRRSPA